MACPQWKRSISLPPKVDDMAGSSNPDLRLLDRLVILVAGLATEESAGWSCSRLILHTPSISFKVRHLEIQKPKQCKPSRKTTNPPPSLPVCFFSLQRNLLIWCSQQWIFPCLDNSNSSKNVCYLKLYRCSLSDLGNLDV